MALTRAFSILGFSVFSVLFAASCTASTPQSSPTKPKPVIVDTDVAVDDWMGLMLLLNHPNIDVRAVTVSGTGETHCGPGVRNVLRLTQLANKSNIPVACGREDRAEGPNPFPTLWRSQADALLDIPLADSDESPSQLNAVELMKKTIDESAQPVTIVALAPLTNIADLLKIYPTSAEKIANMYAMGGAVRVHGNVNDSVPENPNVVSEWNFYGDPVAAANVFANPKLPITLIPLDATNKVPVRPKFLDRLASYRKSPSAEFIFQVMEKRSEFINTGTWYFWDVVGAAIAVEESLGKIESLDLGIKSEPDVVAGQTYIHKHGGKPVRVVTDADAERLEDLYLRAINGDLEP